MLRPAVGDGHAGCLSNHATNFLRVGSRGNLVVPYFALMSVGLGILVPFDTRSSSLSGRERSLSNA